MGRTKELGAIITSMPELRKKKETIDKHTNIATALLNHIKERDLNLYYSIEEALLNKNPPVSLIVFPVMCLPDIRILLVGQERNHHASIRNWKRHFIRQTSFVFDLLPCYRQRTKARDRRVRTAVDKAGMQHEDIEPFENVSLFFSLSYKTLK